MRSSRFICQQRTYMKAKEAIGSGGKMKAITVLPAMYARMLLIDSRTIDLAICMNSSLGLPRYMSA